MEIFFLIVSGIFMIGSFFFAGFAVMKLQKAKQYYIEAKDETKKNNDDIRKSTEPINDDGELNPLYFTNLNVGDYSMQLRFPKKEQENVF